jgi:5-carboxymethyl-2-hydroxymuconate isomerase
MPHLAIQHSGNLTRERMSAICEGLHSIIAGAGPFPLAGIRVRSFPAQVSVIADEHPANAFVDMVFRIGAGRSGEEKAAVGRNIMSYAESCFAEELATPYFALSLEIVEIDPVMSWKTNSIHARLKGKS